MWMTAGLMVLGLGAAQEGAAETRLWTCPDGEFARAAIIDGSIETWPNYAPGPGMRVQQQHPDTGLWAHAKFMQASEHQGAICQYYNSIGFVATMVTFVEGREHTADGVHWREEWIESRPEQDEPGNEMIETCVRARGGAVWPSHECPFVVRVRADAE